MEKKEFTKVSQDDIRNLAYEIFLNTSEHDSIKNYYEAEKILRKKQEGAFTTIKESLKMKILYIGY